jgi:predicted membrane protein
MPVNYYLSDLWPLAIMGFGLYLLLKRKGRRGSYRHNEHGSGSRHSNHKEFAHSEADFIDETTILGSTNKSFSSEQFKGGKILTILGGSEIDLRSCKLGGERQIIDIVAIFGGTTIFLPPEWKVVISVVSIFGGFDDDRRPTVEAEIDNEKVLVIKGTVLFGGGELKS